MSEQAGSKQSRGGDLLPGSRHQVFATNADCNMMVPSDFTPVGSRARWAIVLLAATIVIDVIAIAFDAWDIATINSFLDGRNLDIAPLLRSDHRQTLIGRAQLATFVVAAILFIRWFHASYRNLRSLGTPESRFKPGWAIGVWFVPILNLWRPKQIADEIWNAGDPEVPPTQGEEAPGSSRPAS